MATGQLAKQPLPAWQLSQELWHLLDSLLSLLSLTLFLCCFVSPLACHADSCALPIHLTEACVGLQTALREAGVTMHGGERSAQALGLTPAPAKRHEYGSNALTLELVDSMDEAIDHVHANGSSHTECIVTGALSVQAWWSCTGVFLAVMYASHCPSSTFIPAVLIRNKQALLHLSRTQSQMTDPAENNWINLFVIRIFLTGLTVAVVTRG